MSDINQIKERLRNYKSLHNEVMQIEEKLKETESSINAVKAVVISDMPKSENYDKDSIGKLLAKIEEVRKLYYEKLDEMLCELYFIERLIEKLDPTERRLMRKRYIEGKNWSIVAEEMGYSQESVLKLHKKILLKI